MTDHGQNAAATSVCMAARLFVAGVCALVIGLLPAPSPAFAEDGAPYRIIDGNGVSWTSGPGTVVAMFGADPVAPGATGSYRFTVENGDTQAATFLLTAHAEAEGDDLAPLEVGLVYRLRTADGVYVAGSADAWAPAGELTRIVCDPGGSKQLVLSWSWPFDAGEEADRIDTAVGRSASARLNVELSARIEAEEPAEPDGTIDPAGPGGSSDSPSSQGDPRAFASKLPSTGEAGVLAVIALAALLAVVAARASWVRRRSSERH